MNWAGNTYVLEEFEMLYKLMTESKEVLYSQTWMILTLENAPQIHKAQLEFIDNILF